MTAGSSTESPEPEDANLFMKKTTPLIPEKEIPEEQTEHHPFHEMLGVMSTEDLIRFRCRLQKKGKKNLIALLTQEIDRKHHNGED